MNSNQSEKIHNPWPINIGEFFNPQHKIIKDDLKELSAEEVYSNISEELLLV